MYEFVEKEKDFVVVMWILSDRCSLMDDLKEMDEIFFLFCIYVLKGLLVVSFVKGEYIYVYVWVGVEKKLMIDYEDLFNCFELFVSCNIFKKMFEVID